MTLGQALYTYLSAHAGLIALVGNRIYPGRIPQNAKMPAVSFQKIDEPQIHVDGTDSGPYRPRYQFNSWDPDYEDAAAVAVQVKTALRDYTGTMGGEGGVTVQRIFMEDENDLFDETATDRCGVAQDFIIWHS